MSQLRPPVHPPQGPDVCRTGGERAGLALTVVLGPPGGEGSVGDTARRQCGLLFGRLAAQEDEMRLLPWKEET